MMNFSLSELPLVSIIMPAYNSGEYIDEAIKSVLSQSYKNYELIIIDDCSRDSTFEILKYYSEKYNNIFYYKNRVNRGPGSSRNIGIKKSTGEYIAFLDSDDIWKKHKLKIQIGLMEKNQWVFTHTSFRYITQAGEKTDIVVNAGTNHISYKDLLYKTDIGCLTVVYNQNVIGKMYMPNIRRKQDYALWLSILKKGYKSNPINKVLAYYRYNPNLSLEISYKRIRNHITFLMETQKLDIVKSTYYTLRWLSNGLKRMINK
jgi:teichuronic acid biosynthesis glycosyltransferase TuaG